MKKAKGFTLIELMIVVAIIGVLAAIAVPNFLRYQLRARFAELRTNVEAIYKSETSLRQSERVVCPGAPTGAFAALGPMPAAAPQAQKNVWLATDIGLASAIDWNVQGATYGQYQTATADVPATGAATCAAPAIASFGYALSISAISDIDGDKTGGGRYATVGSWQPSRTAGGTVKVAAPALPLADDLTGCPGGTQPAGIGDGQVTSCSADNVF